jgi:hypothetical protein
MEVSGQRAGTRHPGLSMHSEVWIFESRGAGQ